MEKISDQNDIIIFEKKNKAILLLISISVIILPSTYFVDIPLPIIIVTTGITLVAIIVGTYYESLTIDILNMQLIHKKSILWFNSKIEGDFSNILSVEVIDSSVDASKANRGQIGIQVAWKVILKCDFGDSKRGIDLGIYGSKEKALEEAGIIAGRLHSKLEFN